MDRTEIIRRAGLEAWILPGRTYPHPLPGELDPYYCYTRDGGHSILVVIETEYQEGEDPVRFIIPAPVRTVLRAGFRVQDGFVWTGIPYDSENGISVEEEDVEY